jgi:hypothetical protein
LTLRNGLLYKAKESASKIVLLPAPFSPTMRVVLFLFNSTSVKLLPVERKFLYRIVLKYINASHLSFQHLRLSRSRALHRKDVACPDDIPYEMVP